MGSDARLVKEKKFIGADLAGPATAVAAKARILAATEAFMMTIAGYERVGFEVQSLYTKMKLLKYRLATVMRQAINEGIEAMEDLKLKDCWLEDECRM